MKKTLRSLFFVTFALAMLFALAVCASATDETITLWDEGACGYVMKWTDSTCTTENDGTTNDFYWQINSEGTLIISHNTPDGHEPSAEIQVLDGRDTDAYTYSRAVVPWESYKSVVKKIVFDVDQSFGTTVPYTFAGFTNCTTVVLPDDVTTHLYGANLFQGCTSLVTFGPEGTPEGTFNLRDNVAAKRHSATNVTNGNIFSGCAKGKNITVLMPTAATVTRATVPVIGYIWDLTLSEVVLKANFENATSVTFKVLPGTVGETVANTYAGLYDEGKCTVTPYAEGDLVESGTGNSAKENEGVSVDWEWSVDLVTGVLTVKYVSSTVNGTSNNGYNIYIPNDTMKELATNYGALVTRVNFVGFRQFYEAWKGNILPGSFTKLTTVDFGIVNDFRNSSATVWFNCPALTTFGSSTLGTLKEGVIDLTGTGFRTSTTYSLFNGCSGVKEIIIPDGNLTVSATTFAGFEGLEKITVGKATISDGAFDGLTSLKSIHITDNTFTDDAANKLLPVDVDGLTIVCYTKAVADSLTDYGATRIIYFGDVITSDGFSVRAQKTANSTNGLRTLYTFNKTRRAELEAAGLTFKEFGAIAVSLNRLGSSTLSLSWNGTEYVPNIANAIKVPVFVAGDEGDVQMGKILANNEDSVDFALTLVNFVDNFTSDIYACGYAIFVDENGEEYIEYANYGDIEGKEDWKYVNIFELAMYLYTETTLMSDTVADEEPVWGILGTESVDLGDSQREITLDDGNTSMMIVMDADGGYNLFVRCLDGTMPELTAAQTKATELGFTTLANSVGIMIKDDPDFVIKTSWQNYVDVKLTAAKLTETEKEKTFIFVTDNHWDVNTKNNANVTFATDVMKYISEQLGDAPVVYGGDPFGGYSEDHATATDPYVNINTSLGIIDDYIKDQLYANFGNNFFYALGNHDTNIIGYQKAMNTLGYDQATAMEYYLISDKDMYDHTVGLIADKGIVFDTKGIEEFKAILIDYGYTDEETLTEAEYLMKMHYHYDDEDAKIRFIMLDTGGCGRTQTGIFKGPYTHMIETQFKWLAETLKSTPDGYDVVIAGHQTGESLTNYSDGDVDFTHQGAGLYDIITAFKTGSYINYTYPANSWHRETYGDLFMDVVANQTVDIDFEKEFTGTVFTIGGHWHGDFGWYVNNNGQLTDVQFGDEGKEVAEGAVLALSTGTARNYDPNTDKDGISFESTFPNNMRFDVVTIKDDGSVLLTRIGAGNTRYYTYAG